MSGTSGGVVSPRDPAGEFPFPVTPYLFHLFTVTTRLRDARLDKALKPLGLNVTRHRAVAVIALLEPCTMSELASRATPSEDRRQVVLTLTAKGRAVYQRALKVIDEVNRVALEGLSDEVLRAAARLQQTVLSNLAPDPERARLLLDFRRG